MKNENCGQRGKSAKKPSTFHEMFVISSKKNATNQSIKKESMSDDQGNHVRLFPETKRVASSETSHSQSRVLTESFQVPAH